MKRQMHWRVFDLFRCLGYRCSGEILTDDADRQTGKRTEPQTDRQNERNVKDETMFADC